MLSNLRVFLFSQIFQLDREKNSFAFCCAINYIRFFPDSIILIAFCLLSVSGKHDQANSVVDFQLRTCRQVLKATNFKIPFFANINANQNFIPTRTFVLIIIIITNTHDHLYINCHINLYIYIKTPSATARTFWWSWAELSEHTYTHLQRVIRVTRHSKRRVFLSFRHITTKIFFDAYTHTYRRVARACTKQNTS